MTSKAPLTPCRTCGGPIPWRSRKGYKGRWYQETASAYAKRVYCGPGCSPGAPTGHRLERETQAVRAAEFRRALLESRPLETLGPFDGHACEVCGFPVRRGHPVHRNPNPFRADPPAVRV